ncbi:MAG: coproporphyrinogen III oxidase, partial [Rhizomicrobium sp.]
MDDVEARKALARAWFENLAQRLITAFESLEEWADGGLYAGQAGRFERTQWDRPADGDTKGGGLMGMMRGRLFEKVGVHVSTVHGCLSQEFAKQVKGAAQDPRFWAAGISVIAHMKNPHVPAAHMNSRMIVTTESWFGGGADL